MSINNEQELDSRIRNFLERKTKRFPELTKIEGTQERIGIATKAQADFSEWLYPPTRHTH